MKLKIIVPLVLAAGAFFVGTRVNGAPDEKQPHIGIGMVGYMTFMVDKTSPNSPAEKAGLKKGDSILSLNKHRIISPPDLREAMSDVKAGQLIEVEFIHYDEEKKEYRISKVQVEAKAW